MKRLLPILFMLFVSLLNIRALFCLTSYTQLAYPAFSLYDAIASSKKSSFYPDEKMCLSLLVKKHWTLPCYVDSILHELKDSDLHTELGIQQLRNILKTEINLVGWLQAEKRHKVRAALYDRNEQIIRTAPTVYYFYDQIMNYVTRHGRLVQPKSAIPQKERRYYLTTIKHYLTSIDIELYRMQKSL